MRALVTCKKILAVHIFDCFNVYILRTSACVTSVRFLSGSELGTRVFVNPIFGGDEKLRTKDDEYVLLCR